VKEVRLQEMRRLLENREAKSVKSAALSAGMYQGLPFSFLRMNVLRYFTHPDVVSILSA